MALTRNSISIDNVINAVCDLLELNYSDVVKIAQKLVGVFDLTKTFK